MFVFVDESSNVGFTHKEGAHNMLVDFQCRYHSDPIIPALPWSSQHIDCLHLDFGIK
jgi:hypothetical protein